MKNEVTSSSILSAVKNETAVFGGGCFWCTEATFRELKGVIDVTPGYAGGVMPDPTYEKVCGVGTGHAEVIRVAFDSNIIRYDDLLTVFFAMHDPTTLHRQGADAGTQYRSIILYTSETQKLEAQQFIENLNASEGGRVVTEVKPLEQFYPAENYHQRYYEKNKNASYCQIVINPKLDKLREKFEQLLKK